MFVALGPCVYCVRLNVIFVEMVSVFRRGGGGELWPGIAHTVALWEGNSHFRHLFVFCFSKKRWDNRGSVNLINRASAIQQWHDGLSC